jgi:type I restriction-modification system DNA methylase subunit
MEIKEILDSKEKLISFLKSQGFEEEPSYKDREYKGVVFLKIGEKKLLAVCEAFSKEKIKEIKNHFLIDRGLTHVAIFFRDKIIFYRNYGERRYFIYSRRTADNISKINKLKKIGENFDVIFQTKDISGTFYEQFKLKRDLLVRAIKNDIEPVKKYLIAQKIFDRIFFIYFLCHKKIVRFDDGRELSGKVFFDILIENGDFIENLRKTFTLFNTPHKNNILRIGDYKIRIPYLNGGLFREAEEEKDLKISLKKKDWQKIFEFLNSYHWIIESEVEELTEEIEEEETKILTPEILGHVYERSVVEWELKGFKKEVEDATKGVSERKKKGVYYTPEEITDYLCKNTIYPYLLDNLGNKYKDINEFLEKASVSDIKKALKVLDEIKVLDPACGSGAFLLKAGEVLFYLKTALLNKLGKKPNYYEIKHSIITENLYGVDILEGAIEIAKLRLWLWLVSSYKEEKEIQALPNIEYNLVVGNSLIGWVNEKLTQVSLTNPMTPEIKGIFKGLIANSIYEKKELQKAKELLERQDANALEGYIEAYHILYTIYKKAHGERARDLKDILNTIRDAIYKSINPAFLNYINKKIKPNHKPTNPPIKLEDFEALNPLHWRVDFGHIIKKGGFDIVIGNPPYGQDKLKKIERKILIYALDFESLISDKDIKGSYNISVAFIERSYYLINSFGKFGYIVNNSIARVDEFGKIRKFLLEKTSIYELVDAGNPFKESGVTLEMIIIFFKKTPIEKHLIVSSRRFQNYRKKIPVFLFKKYNRFIFYPDEIFKFIFDNSRINILSGTRGRDIEKKKVRNINFMVPYLFSGKSVKKFFIDTKFIEFANKEILKSKSWKEEYYDKDTLITTKINDRYRVTIKPPKTIIGNNVIKLKYLEDNISSKALVILLNSKLMDYVIKKYVINYSELTVAFYDSITMFTPIKIPSNQQPFIHLADILLFLNQYHYDNFKSINQENKELEEKIEFFDDLANCLVYELYLKEKLKTNLIKLVENKLKDVDYDNWIKLEFKDDLTPAERKKKEEIEKKNLKIIDKMFNELKNSKEIENEMKKIKSHEWVRIIEGGER